MAERVLDGGQGLADAGVVGDDAVLQRDVEVDADEHALVWGSRLRMESFMSVMRITEVALHGMAACEERAFILRLVQTRTFVRRADLMPQMHN